MEKEYYRLNEVKSRFGLSFEDIKYLVQESKITPVFYLQNQQYIVGSWFKSKGFVAHAKVFYKGLVYLNHDAQLTLLNKGRVRALEFGLVKPQNMQNISTTYPLRTPTPNTFMYSWEPLTEQELLQRPLGARLLPNESVDWFELVNSLVEGVAEASQKAKEYSSFDEAGNITFEPLPASDKFNIKDQNQLLKAADILILRQELIRLEIIKGEAPQAIQHQAQIEASPSESKETENKPPKITAPDAPKKRSNQLTELLERVLADNPTISAKETWRVLEEEVSKELDERLFDTDGILMDVSHSEIAWKSRYGNLSSTKLTTFDAAVSRVRKRLSNKVQ